MLYSFSKNTYYNKTFDPSARAEMLLKFLSDLENPFHPLLGPNLRGLKFWGLWQPDGSRFAYNVFHVIFVIFNITQYIECWLIRSHVEMVMRNLSVTIMALVCIGKVWSFLFWQKSWQELIECVSDMEISQLSKGDAVIESVIAEYTKYSRKITYLYWSLVTATFIIVVSIPLAVFLSSSEQELILNGTLPYPEVVSSWSPFDRTRGFGYWLMSIVQSMMCAYGGGVVASYDSNAVVIMTFLVGQLKILSLNCERLCGDENEAVSANEVIKRIRDCHYHHVHLIKYATILNSLLSPVLFLYVIICSLMICASAVQMTREGTGNVQRLLIAEFLLALVTQLFIYCWHSNEVLYMSYDVDNGVYASAWWSHGVRVRRGILLLAGQLRRSIIFTAGPFTPLTVSTFIAIMKASYSYYTLLSAHKD